MSKIAQDEFLDVDAVYYGIYVPRRDLLAKRCETIYDCLHREGAVDISISESLTMTGEIHVVSRFSRSFHLLSLLHRIQEECEDEGILHVLALGESILEGNAEIALCSGIHSHNATLVTRNRVLTDLIDEYIVISPIRVLTGVWPLDLALQKIMECLILLRVGEQNAHEDRLAGIERQIESLILAVWTWLKRCDRPRPCDQPIEEYSGSEMLPQAQVELSDSLIKMLRSVQAKLQESKEKIGLGADPAWLEEFRVRLKDLDRLLAGGVRGAIAPHVRKTSGQHLHLHSSRASTTDILTSFRDRNQKRGDFLSAMATALLAVYTGTVAAALSALNAWRYLIPAPAWLANIAIGLSILSALIIITSFIRSILDSSARNKDAKAAPEKILEGERNANLSLTDITVQATWGNARQFAEEINRAIDHTDRVELSPLDYSLAEEVLALAKKWRTLWHGVKYSAICLLGAIFCYLAAFITYAHAWWVS